MELRLSRRHGRGDVDTAERLFHGCASETPACQYGPRTRSPRIASPFLLSATGVEDVIFVVIADTIIVIIVINRFRKVFSY